MKPAYRIEIVEQEGGWWAGEIWDANDEIVYRAHARSKEVAQEQAATEFAKYFKSTTKPVETITPLKPN